ncbi:MAG: GTPase [Halorubrum sp.]|uniref:HflX-like GTP-binding protein n=1 Tax=Halorubrum sp. TaxID=1879286 RepID=UPI003970F8BB
MPRDDPGTEADAEPPPADAPTAVVAARATDERPDTTDIRESAAAAGYAVVGEVTQRRREDPTYGLGRGKAEDLMRLAADTDAEAVIYDGELSPGQTFSLGDLLPTGTAVVDRPRLVLELLADAVDSRAADLQLELARLRYELPRLRETAARDSGEDVRLRPEGDGRVRDLERRVDAVERALDEVVDDRAARRAERRAAGFDLVVLAGYADAGKSALARRLADDVDDGPPAGGDRSSEALSTATHRATIGGRRTLLTDTVGFLDGVPQESVRSFRATLDAVRTADCALLVVDVSDDPEVFRRKLRDSLAAIGTTEAPVIPVLSGADEVSADALADAVATVGAVAGEVDEEVAAADEPAPVAAALRAPVAVGARDGTGVTELADAVADALPTATATVQAPNGGETQAALSWAYDRGVVADVDYGTSAVVVDLAGRPAVVAEAERRLGGREVSGRGDDEGGDDDSDGHTDDAGDDGS